MSVDRALATATGEVPAIYHQGRPPYPDELFEAIVDRTAIPPKGSILEIGCGTGRATAPLAERGFRIHCLEPSQKHGVEARKNLEGFGVEIENAFFEDWPLPTQHFDVVLSAEAFHWVPPSVRVPKAAAALRPGGAIALFWNLLERPQAELGAAFQRAFRAAVEDVPSFVSLLGELDSIKAEIEQSGSFDALEVWRCRNSRMYDPAGYRRLLATHPLFVALVESKREAILRDSELAVESVGGIAEIGFNTVLYVARKKQRAPAWARRLPLPVRRFGNRILGR